MNIFKVLCTVTFYCLSLTVFAQTCNSNIILTKPSDRYIDLTDGTISDTKTGLIWMRCSIGQTWDGSNCVGTASSLTWTQALSTAESIDYASSTDWRVPNLKELLSTIEEACTSPTINETTFPDTNIDWYWTSTPTQNDAENVWLIHYSNGLPDNHAKNTSHSLRLVRTE
jgi:hypothetical protein